MVFFSLKTLEEIYHSLQENIKQHKHFNTDNIKKCFLSSKSAR